MKFDGCLKTLPVGLSEMPDEPIGAEEEQQIFSGTFVKIRSRRDGVPLVEIRVSKLTD